MNNNGDRTYLPNTQIEVLNPDIRRAPFGRAMFDFDGTVSLVREGWDSVMVAMMVEILQATPRAEDEAALRRSMAAYVDRSTGRHTIHQMKQLVVEVEQRGGRPKSPEAYKQDYLNRLNQRIDQRKTALKWGQLDPIELTVPGILDILATLRQQGLTCYLASGTDEHFVIEEAKLLGAARFFDGGIYGARDDGKAVSKQRLIERITANHHHSEPDLVVFGDGPDEIRHAAAAGCVAVGVASNEAERQGIDERKRQRLIEAGADLIIPDFREHEILLKYLTGT